MLDLLLIRHGMSVRNYVTDLAFEGNVEPLELHMREHPDEKNWPLYETGFKQSQRAGDWLRTNYPRGFDGAYVSPFLRAMQTAETLALPGVEWRQEPRIRERYWGLYGPETQPPYTAQEYMHDIRQCGQPTFCTRLPGAEALVDLYEPAKSFLTDLCRDHPTGTVAIVSHGGTMRSLQMVLDGISPEHCDQLQLRPTDNCWIVRYRFGCAGRAGPKPEVEVVNPWSDL